jgi:hypothetical protein
MNKRGPVEITVCRLELRREDHRAPVDRVDTDGAVIAPAGQRRSLNKVSYQDGCFVTQRSRRI